MAQILVFEDETYKNFLPLTYPKPLCELACGGRRQRERFVEAFPQDDLAFLVREYLTDAYREKTGCTVNTIERSEGALLLNSALLIQKEELNALKTSLSKGEALVRGDTLLAMHADRRVAEKIADRATTGGKLIMDVARRHGAIREDNKLQLLRFPWDITRLHEEMMRADIAQLPRRDYEQLSPDVGTGPVLVHEDATIERDVFIDTRKGGVLVDESAEVQFPTRIAGPSWIGRESTVFSALLREGSRVGPVCKVGGEMETSVLEEHSNKAHAGYLGHSYVGEWVNVGAMAVTSDLKNTYGTVRMEIDGNPTDSGATKLGAFIADHAKISISTSIYAGKKIGVASHASGLINTDVPSFTIWTSHQDQQPRELFLDSAIETQRRMAARRQARFTQAQEKLMRHIFDTTRDERLRRGVKRGSLAL